MESGRPNVLLIAGTVLVSLAVGAACLFALSRGGGSRRVPAPAAFDSFTSGDRSFAMAAPHGWQSVSGDSHGVSSAAVFAQGSARIVVASDLSGSLMGDILRSSNAQLDSLQSMMPQGGALGMPDVQNAPQPKAPVEKLHDMGKKHAAQELAEYQEQPAQAFQCPYGEGRYSEFAGNGGMFVGSVHGYRATILGVDRSVTVEARCAEADWPVLKPAFARVIGSITRGPG